MGPFFVTFARMFHPLPSISIKFHQVFQQSHSFSWWRNGWSKQRIAWPSSLFREMHQLPVRWKPTPSRPRQKLRQPQKVKAPRKRRKLPPKNRTVSYPVGFGGSRVELLWTEEIPHHLGWLKPCKQWDKPPQLVQDFFHPQYGCIMLYPYS